MEYRSQDSSPTLASAVSLFARLNKAGVRYGIFKSSRNTVLALAGDQDLDILVEREDYRRFCAIAAECAAIRSVNHRSLVAPGREDWFVPDFERAKYLHLDVHVSVRLGGKFNKRYPCYSYSDIRHWGIVSFGDCSIPIVSPQDEATITLSRIAFRSNGKTTGLWQRLTGDWAQEIDHLVFSDGEAGLRSVWCETRGLKLRCRIRKQANELWLHRKDLAKLRRNVRARNGAPAHSAIADGVINGIRSWQYAVSRVMAGMFPGATVDRRRPASGGLIVAVIAPDGMGKSTQVDRIYRLFRWKFCCAKLYLGSGDGGGWWVRRIIRTLYVSRRSEIKATLLDGVATERASPGLRSRLGSFLLSLWGLLVALERHSHVRMARRMADSGFLVFCDRWPQSIQPGFMDGPTPDRRSETPGLLRHWELSLYDRMTRIQPDITVHLVGEYAVSQARKPGELRPEEFDKRVSLMTEIRAGAPHIHVIDAGGDVDEVARSLFALVWKAL
jgi:thymidylate kinase